MAIDRTPVLKRCRQLGIDPAELGYSSKKESIRQPKRRRKESEYGMQLREKQKVKFIYGVLEKQFRGYFNKAKRQPGITGENLMRILESRLDSVIFRLGFARTRKEARQIVTHGHIMVNGRRVDVPSYRVKAGDVVSVAPKSKELLVIKSALVSNEGVQVPAWLEVDIEKLQGSMKTTSVKAEVAGEVKSVNPDGGTDNQGNPLPLICIVQTGGFRVKGYVNENNAASGTISSIDWNNPAKSSNNNYYDSGSSDTGNSSKYPFYVELSSSDGLLMGQHVYIEPDLGQDAQNTGIQLPASFINDADSSPWVWAQSSSGKLEKRSLTLGDYNAELDTYAVTDGLTAADYIAFPDDTLKAGMTCVTYDESTFDPSGDGSYADDGGVMDGGFDAGMDIPEGDMTDGAVDMPADGLVTDEPVEG